jgi:hypothetical protein
MPDIEVKLNWFQRHLNWTYGPIAFAGLSFICGYQFLGLFSFIGDKYTILGLLTILIIISAGIWVIVSKGRSLWMLVIFALWPPMIVWIEPPLLPGSLYLWGIWIFLMTLVAGITINVIIVLALTNKKYKRVVAIENGKSVVKWYKIDKTISK